MVQLLIPSAYQVSIEMTVSGQQVINVIGIRSDEVQKTANDVCAAVKTGWEIANGPLKQLASQIQMVGYRCTDLRSTNGDIDFQPSTATGGMSGQSLSTLAVAALVQYGQGTRNRSSRGRMYFGPLSEANINTDGRTLLPTSLTSINAAMEVFRSHIAGANMQWAVLSRVQKQAYSINTVQVASVVATQRRRLR
jgi:hypothetical protein